jgi:hypothetical protein
MWEFYLAAAEMAFREQAMMVFQIQLTKRQVEANKKPQLRLAGE